MPGSGEETESVGERSGPPPGIHRWILLGLVAGIVLGLAANALTAPGAPAEALRPDLEKAIEQVIYPIGGIFLRLLFMTVIPLVVSCLALAIHDMGDIRQVGRIGLKTLAFTVVLSSISVTIGLLLVNVIEPGARLDPATRAELLEREKARAPQILENAARGAERPRLERIVNAVIPRNPLEAGVRAFDGEMIGVMGFALLFGCALAACRGKRTETLVRFLEGLYDVSIWLVGLAIRLAPVGVAALLFSMTARMGFGILYTLGAYVGTVLLGLAIQQFGVYPLFLSLLCGWNPLRFFSLIRPVMITAFSTSSSNATLPTTIHVARTRLGIPERVANFVLTLGSTFNQNGTALFEGITVLFLAQFYGVELGLDQQITVLLMSIVAGIGTAGVPGGSLPLIVPVLVSVGVPAEGIAVILGVDRLLDMCRTVLNVTGDMVAAAFVARREGRGSEAPG